MPRARWIRFDPRAALLAALGPFAAVAAGQDVAPTAAPAAAPAPAPTARVIAATVFAAADDFVVDVWHNGRKLADDRRHVVHENFGATSEKVDVEVKEGDWLVFHVANNRLRWGGAAYFGAAGLDASGRVGFESKVGDGRWSYCDDPGEVPAFIARAEHRAGQAALAPAVPWGGGDGEMKRFVPDWSGRPVWGRERSTWIKYVAPAPGTWAPAPQAIRLALGGRLKGHPDPATSLAVSRDGRTAVSVSSTSYDADLRAMKPDPCLVWDLSGVPHKRAAFPIGQSAFSVAMVPDGKLAVVPEGNRFHLVNLADGRRAATLAGPERVNALAVAASPDGRTVAGSVDGDVILYNLTLRKPIRSIRTGDRSVGRLAFSPDGRRLATGSGGGVRLWDVATGQSRGVAAIPDRKDPSTVTALAYTPDGNSLAAVVDGSLWLLDPATGAAKRELGKQGGLSFHEVSFSADGKWVAATGVSLEDSKFAPCVGLVDFATGAVVAQVVDPDGRTSGVAFHPDGRRFLASGGGDVKVWNLIGGP